MHLLIVVAPGHLSPVLWVICDVIFAVLRCGLDLACPPVPPDVMSVTVVRMTVTRQSLNRASSVSYQNQRKKLHRHKLKGP